MGMFARTAAIEVGGKVEGQPRPRLGFARGGKPHVYSPSCAWRAKVAHAWRASGERPFGCVPVIVEVKVFRSLGGRPDRADPRYGEKMAAYMLKHPRPDDQKPDADNIAKAALDGLVDAGAIDDDSQVVGLIVTKEPLAPMESEEDERAEISVHEIY